MSNNDIFDFDEDIKVHKKKPSKTKKKNKSLLIMFYFSMLLLIVAVSFDIMFIYINKQNEQRINSLISEKEGLLNEIDTNYITNEQARVLAEKEVKKALSEVVVEKNDNDDGREQLKEEIIAMFENGDNLLKILENVYEDKIVVPDSSGYYFFDIDENLEKHGLDFDISVFLDESHSGKFLTRVQPYIAVCAEISFISARLYAFTVPYGAP